MNKLCFNCVIFDTVIGHFNDSSVDKLGMKYEVTIYFLSFDDALHKSNLIINPILHNMGRAKENPSTYGLKAWR